MCPDNKNEQPIGNLWTDIWELMSHFINFSPIFSGIVLVIPGDVANPIFSTTIMIFIKGLTMYLCYGI